MPVSFAQQLRMLDSQRRDSHTDGAAPDAPPFPEEDEDEEDPTALPAPITLEGLELTRAQFCFVLDDDLWGLPNPGVFLERAAVYFSSLTILVLFTSSLILCLESIPKYYMASLENGSIWYKFEITFVAYFSMEYLLRLWAAPDRWVFVKKLINILDLLAVLPFFIEFAVEVGGTLDLRILRLFRIGKVFRYSPGMRIVFRAFTASSEILLLCLIVFLIALILWSSILYFVEREFNTFDTKRGYWNHTKIRGMEYVNERSPFQSIFHTMWWTIVTISTVGYGDEVPISWGGKLVASFAMFSGVFVISIPTSVVGSNFLMLYHQQDRLSDPVESVKVDPVVVALISATDTLVEEGLIRQQEAFYVQRMLYDTEYAQRLKWVYNASLLAVDPRIRSQRLVENLRDLIEFSEEQNRM